MNKVTARYVHFCETWNDSSSFDEVTHKLGMTRRQVRDLVYRLSKRYGAKLKDLPPPARAKRSGVEIDVLRQAATASFPEGCGVNKYFEQSDETSS